MKANWACAWCAKIKPQVLSRHIATQIHRRLVDGCPKKQMSSWVGLRTEGVALDPTYREMRMIGLVNWVADRARMVLAFIAISLLVGGFAYVSLPNEGEPDIEIPDLFISVPFPGISAEDSETLLVKVMETELADLDGLDKMSATAAEGYAGVALEFDFGWDKTAVMADVRDAMNAAEAISGGRGKIRHPRN